MHAMALVPEREHCTARVLRWGAQHDVEKGGWFSVHTAVRVCAQAAARMAAPAIAPWARTSASWNLGSSTSGTKREERSWRTTCNSGRA